jgi:hypothetical protein
VSDVQGGAPFVQAEFSLPIALEKRPVSTLETIKWEKLVLKVCFSNGSACTASYVEVVNWCVTNECPKVDAAAAAAAAASGAGDMQ